MTAWPNGYGVWLRIRRLWVRVPSWSENCFVFYYYGEQEIVGSYDGDFLEVSPKMFSVLLFWLSFSCFVSVKMVNKTCNRTAAPLQNLHGESPDYPHAYVHPPWPKWPKIAIHKVLAGEFRAISPSKQLQSCGERKVFDFITSNTVRP